MTPQIAKNILLFLERVQLTGKEVPAWIEAVNALNEFVTPPKPDL